MEEQSTRKHRNQFSQGPSPLSFVLKRTNQSENQYLPVPNTQLMFDPSITPQSHSSVVSFNNDHNPYTPAFVDSTGKVQVYSIQKEASVRVCDFKKLFEAEITQKKESCTKIGSQNIKKPTLIKPQPNSKYCLVCKETFINYFTHINHPIHSKRIAQSEATQYIEDLVQFVSIRNKKEIRQNITRCQKSKKSQSLLQTSLSKELVDRHNFNLFQTARKQFLRATKNQ